MAKSFGLQELIEAKKKKALSRDFFHGGVLSIEESGGLREKMTDGVSVKKDNANFGQIQESKQEDGQEIPKDFLLKAFSDSMKKDGELSVNERNIFGQIFGTELYRILSAKQFTARRASGIKVQQGAGQEPKYYIGSKWKNDLEQFQSESTETGDPLFNLDFSKQEDREFIVKYARLCGVMVVLGETDFNRKNYLRDKEQNRPVAIDRSALASHILGYDGEHSCYGCAMSKDFLYIFLGDFKENLAYKKYHDLNFQSDKTKPVDARNKDIHSFLVQTADLGMDSYEKNILKKIKERAKNDPLIADCFVSFMDGLQDAVFLSENRSFMKKFCDKMSQDFAKEFGQEKEKEFLAFGKKLDKFFYDNAQRAQREFSQYFDLKREIKKQRQSDVGASPKKAQASGVNKNQDAAKSQ
jgi:hypothetical protein